MLSISLFYPDSSILAGGIYALSVDMDIVYTADGTIETGFFYMAVDGNSQPITADIFPQWHNNYSDGFAAETAFIGQGISQ